MKFPMMKSKSHRLSLLLLACFTVQEFLILGNASPAKAKGRKIEPPVVHGHSFTYIKFSYDDSSPIGPKHWENNTRVQDARTYGGTVYTTNLCHEQWISPLNIDTKDAVAPEDENVVDDSKDAELLRSVIIFIPREDIEKTAWDFGHPMDAYHGIEIRAPHLGTFQLTDRFDYIAHGLDLGWTGVNEFTNYDFNYASLFYCDPGKAASDRSMHQIDGKRFPLEIDFVFFNQPPRIGYDNFICKDKIKDHCKTVGVILTVLAEFADKDNPRLQPLIDTAAIYEGQSFAADDEEEGYRIPIKGPWSPTWLIPQASQYYYYDAGSFPVPPCWFASRVYVLKERITISRKQLNVLANIKTVREPQNKLPCTYSVLQKQRGDETIEIRFNETPLDIRGDDHRPMSEQDRKVKATREKRRTDLERNMRIRKSDGKDSGDDQSGSGRIAVGFNAGIISLLYLMMT